MNDRKLLAWPPPDRGNPYVHRLNDALAARGVSVRTHRYLAALCARPSGGAWLHLHWPEWMMQHPDRRLYRARVTYVMGLLDMARAQGVSIAWTAHNLFGHDDPHPDLAASARRALLRRCAVVFGHFDAAEAPLRSLGFSGRFALTPHPHAADDLPPPMGREAARAAESVEPDALLLVSFGAIERYKGLSSFAAALSTVQDDRLRYVVAGRVKDVAEHRALIDAAARDRRVSVRAGYVDAPGLSRLVTAADATVLPYRDFFTSGAAMLSLTLSTPLIAPPWNHFRAMSSAPFLAPLPSLAPSVVRAAVARARSFTDADRIAARAAAMATGYDDIARTLDLTLFGASA